MAQAKKNPKTKGGAEVASTTSKAYLRAVIDTVIDGIITIDEGGIVQTFNPAAERMFGYSASEVVGRSVNMLMPEPHHGEHDGYIGRYLKTGEAKIIGIGREVEARRKDGRTFPIALAVSEMQVRGERMFTAIVRDITERRRAEEELHARARQQAAVAQLGHKALSGVSMPVLMDEAVNLVGQTLNVEFCKVLELLPDGDALLLRAGVGWKKGLVGKATVPTAAESQAGYALLSSGPVVVEDLRTETRFSGPPLLKDHDVVSGLSVMIHGQKQPFGVLGAHTTRHRRFTPDDVNFVQAIANVLADAIERKRAEVALRESEARHRELFELSPIGIWEEDYSGAKRMIDRLREEGVRDFRRYFREHPEVLRQMAQAIKVIDVNPALIDIYRASDKEAYLRAVTDSSRIEQWCRFYEEELAALAAGEGRIVVEHPDKAYDGSDIVTRTVTQIGEAYKDSWARVISTEEDITEQKRIQAQLIQASKLSTLGEMATGIAHELNQPLSVISMAAERAMDKFEGGDVDLEFISERLKQVIAQTERAAAIIDHMRIFGRLEEDKAPTRIDPRPAIEGALDTIGEQLRVLNIEVTTDLPRMCSPVLGHEVQLEQVVLNLLSNARDAIEASRGQTDRKGEPPGVIGVNVVVAESGKKIKMVVRDTGGGIPEAVIGRLFDPFFTTKEKGEGTGLGLSISYGVITDMGGRIEVANVEGGAEFTIRLPAAEAEQAA